MIGALLLVGPIALADEASTAASAARVDAADFDSLQAAIDAVPATGGIVMIPPGKYELTEPLVIATGDVRIEGSGAATHLVCKHADGRPAVHIRDDGYAKDRRKKLWRVQLADLRISGEAGSGDGILAHGVNEIYLHGVSIDHMGGHGISLVDCYEDARVCDSILTYNKKAGVNIHACHDMVISSNHFEENDDALVCTDSFNLCMTGNNIDDHLGNGVVIEKTYGSVVSGNMIEECQGVGVRLDRDCYGITLSANVIAHNFGGGIDLVDAHGCAVSANTFVLNSVSSLTIGPNSGRIPVTGNSFCNSHIGGKIFREPKHDTAVGVQLVGTSHIVLSGNTFTGLTGAAITADDACQRLVITGNNATDLYRTQEGKGPAFDVAAAKESLVENNLADDVEGE